MLVGERVEWEGERVEWESESRLREPEEEVEKQSKAGNVKLDWPNTLSGSVLGGSLS
jgi:hypothetical protein